VSVQFGRWNFDGKAVDPDYIGKVRRLLEPYAPDGVALCAKEAFVMLYGSLNTTEEACRERQPFSSPAGIFLTWDGRLDNGAEIRKNLDAVPPSPTDLEIVASAWEQFGTRTLPMLLGDWALSVLNHCEHSLVLAKDFLGVRPLYYLRRDRYVAWSSLLGPLILLSGERFTLSEEYIAGWLAGFPAADLTPYREVRSVPPASSVTFTGGASKVERFWDFRPQPLHPRQSDADYEERFRSLLFEAVRRRLRSHTPVIAELSGGLDSSSIVCVADHLAAEKGAKPLETISFFDDTEPNWNERPYFAAVESRRGQTGFHLNVAGDGRLIPERDGSFPSTPAYGARPSGPQRQLRHFLAKGGYRVLLSGIGGDEFTGGVPTGIPELADLVRQGDIPAFVHRAFLWAMASRKPLVHVAGTTLRSFLPTIWVSGSRAQWPMPWLTRSFVGRNQPTLRSFLPRFHWFGGSPVFQENVHALDGLRRQIACTELAPCPGCEKRYPFLDRDLLQFLFAVPRDQLVRPHHRRSLLRRALREIVPATVLDRARKAYVAKGLLKAISSDWERVIPLTQGMLLESHRVVDPAVLRAHLENARRGAEAPLLPLLRVLRFEWWLRDPGLRRLITERRCVPAEGPAVSHRTSGSA